MRSLKSAAVLAALCSFAACGAGAGAIGCNAGHVLPRRGEQPKIVINAASPRPTIDVVNVPPNQLALIAGADSREAWTSILRVGVGIDRPPAVGQYSIDNNIVRFTPMFPLDRGRKYEVTFTAPGADPITAVVGLPPPDTTPTTSAEVYPTIEVLPENVRRFLIHFSAPMGARGGFDFIHLLDESGQEVKDPFLPLDSELWDEDRTQYTVFLDPDQHALTNGKTYKLVVDYAWPDSKGLQLKQTVNRAFTVGPADTTPPDPKAWKIDPPSLDTPQLVITFPEPLDYDSMLHAIGVVSPTGKIVEGDAVLSNHELTWSFIPDEPWVPGSYSIAVLGTLQDLAGNGIGKDQGEKILIPFSVR